MSQWSNIENYLMNVDAAMLAVLNDKCIVGEGTDLEVRIPAVMTGVEEEFVESGSPKSEDKTHIFVINALDLNLDLTRQCQERQILAEQGDDKHKRIKIPMQAYKIGYVITGYSYHMRVYRSMQWFMATMFPVLQAYITVNGEKLRVDSKTKMTNVDYSNQEFTCQFTYDVWVELDVDEGKLVRLPENVIIRFINKERKAVENTEETFIAWGES